MTYKKEELRKAHRNKKRQNQSDLEEEGSEQTKFENIVYAMPRRRSVCKGGG